MRAAKGLIFNANCSSVPRDSPDSYQPSNNLERVKPNQFGGRTSPKALQVNFNLASNSYRQFTIEPGNNLKIQCKKILGRNKWIRMGDQRYPDQTSSSDLHKEDSTANYVELVAHQISQWSRLSDGEKTEKSLRQLRQSIKPLLALVNTDQLTKEQAAEVTRCLDLKHLDISTALNMLGVAGYSYWIVQKEGTLAEGPLDLSRTSMISGTPQLFVTGTLGSCGLDYRQTLAPLSPQLSSGDMKLNTTYRDNEKDTPKGQHEKAEDSPKDPEDKTEEPPKDEEDEQNWSPDLSKLRHVKRYRYEEDDSDAKL